MSSRAFRVCSSVGQKCGYLFAIRSIFRDYSMYVMLFLVVVFSGIFGYMYRVIEYPNRFVDPSHPSFTITNSIWSAIVTMTTVGYGDVIPHTGTGGYIGLFCTIFGIQLTALFVAAFMNIFTFTKTENLSYELLESVILSDRQRKLALNHIVSFYKFKHRGTKRAKEIYRRTHSTTLTINNTFKCKWVEEQSYRASFRLFTKFNKKVILRRLQSISQMDL